MEDKHLERMRALESAVGVMESVQRMLSQSFTLLTPRSGMECAWEHIEKTRRTLQEMMKEERTQMEEGKRRHVRSDDAVQRDQKA